MGDAPRVSIRNAAAGDLDGVRALCRQYAESLPYSLCFQDFDAEMAGLPGKYAEPNGRLLVAERVVGSHARPSTSLQPDAPTTRGPSGSEAPEILGCIALRPLDPAGFRAGDPERVCEMKRLYVQPSARGLGAGRLLCERLIAEARRIGYQMMKLDSDENVMVEANKLYRSLGFHDITPYNDDPMVGTVWLGMRLDPA